MSDTQDPAKGGPEKKFDVLHSALVDYQQRFISVGFSGTGFILIVIGWIVTSDKLHQLLRQNVLMPLFAIFVIVLAGVAYVLLSLRVLRIMRLLKKQLEELDYLPPEYYAFRIMQRWAVVTFMSLNVAATVTAILLIVVVASG